MRVVRVARSKKTGQCQGYSFVVFDDPTVAQLACEATDGYLMFEKRLRCKQLPLYRVPKVVLTGKQILPEPDPADLLKQQEEMMNRSLAGKSSAAKKGDRLRRRLDRSAAKLAAAGINYRLDTTGSTKATATPKVEKKPKQESLVKEAASTKKSESSGSDGSGLEDDDDITFAPVPGLDFDDSFCSSTVSTGSRVPLIIDSSDSEIVFRSPPNTVRKSKRTGRRIRPQQKKR